MAKTKAGKLKEPTQQGKDLVLAYKAGVEDGQKAQSKEDRLAIRIARCEGIKIGRARSQKLITKLNAALLEVNAVIDVLDTDWPRAHVRLSFAMTERIMAALEGQRTKETCKIVAGELRRLYEQCVCDLGRDLAKVENEMRELIG